MSNMNFNYTFSLTPPNCFADWDDDTERVQGCIAEMLNDDEFIAGDQFADILADQPDLSGRILAEFLKDKPDAEALNRMREEFQRNTEPALIDIAEAMLKAEDEQSRFDWETRDVA